MHTTTNTRIRKAAVATVLVAACLPLAACAGVRPSTPAAPVAAAAKAAAAAKEAAEDEAILSAATPGVDAYAALGPFGAWAKKFDLEYRLSPDFKDWNSVADQNCHLQRQGDTDAMVGPYAMTSLQQPLGPLDGRVWAASVLTRCPELLNTPPVAEQRAEKIAGLTWVDPGWRSKLAAVIERDVAHRFVSYPTATR